MQVTTHKNLNDIKQIVQQDLKQVDALISQQLTSPIQLIRQVVSHILQKHGKRLRPLVVVLAAKAAGFSGENEHIELATIMEFVHTATLLHDDVVDDSELRRGQQTANTLFGNQASVLVGDFLYSRSFQLLTQRGHVEVMRNLAATTNAIAEGEVMQLMNQFDTSLTEEQYNEVIYRKTAKLFESSAEIGAIITTQDATIRKALATYGKHLGMAFQIVDDILDYTADSTELGKNIGDDLASGKLTLPLIITLQRVDATTRHTIHNIVEQGNTQDLQVIMQAMHDCQALDYCTQRAQHHIHLAQQQLAAITDNPYRQTLMDLTHFAIERVY